MRSSCRPCGPARRKLAASRSVRSFPRNVLPIRTGSETEGNSDMEYGEVINSDAASHAFSVAVELWEEGHHNAREIAIRAVASAYCACVTDGEDAAERRLSDIHANLIEEVERRLANLMTQGEKGRWP